MGGFSCSIIAPFHLHLLSILLLVRGVTALTGDVANLYRCTVQSVNFLCIPVAAWLALWYSVAAEKNLSAFILTALPCVHTYLLHSMYVHFASVSCNFGRGFFSFLCSFLRKILCQSSNTCSVLSPPCASDCDRKRADDVLTK